MARRRIDQDQGVGALRAWLRGDATPANERTAVRYTLEELGERAPGGSVEIRVPPAGVVQAIAGPRHKRGTPPNVVETNPTTWLQLVTGRISWADAVSQGVVSASGQRADLSSVLPMFER